MNLKLLSTLSSIIIIPFIVSFAFIVIYRSKGFCKARLDYYVCERSIHLSGIDTRKDIKTLRGGSKKQLSQVR
jgi:hypothetical protein